MPMCIFINSIRRTWHLVITEDFLQMLMRVVRTVGYTLVLFSVYQDSHVTDPLKDIENWSMRYWFQSTCERNFLPFLTKIKFKVN